MWTVIQLRFCAKEFDVWGYYRIQITVIIIIVFVVVVVVVVVFFIIIIPDVW